MNRDLKSLMTVAYRRLHFILPRPVAEKVSDCVYVLTRKPYVYFNAALQPENRLEKGVVVISLDMELAWAWQYGRTMRQDARSLGMRERKQVPILLSLFDEFEIPATWAIVGHLFLQSCSRDAGGLAHSEMPRSDHFKRRYWQFTTGDWYQHDPCSNATSDPLWYAPDLVEAIIAARSKHELGCHGFSHLGLQDCPPDVAAAELDACLLAARPYGVRLSTFVFPGNESGNFELLRRKGFRSVRTYPVPWAEISLPMLCHDGLWHVHTSLSLEDGFDSSSCRKHLLKLLRCVDTAAQTRLAAHFWFHPSLSPVQIQYVLWPLVRYCAQERAAGRIDVLTIDQLVNKTEQALFREQKYAGAPTPF